MRRILCVLLAVALFFTGCAPQNSPSNGNVLGTVENVFTIPSTTATDPTATNSTDSAAPPNSGTTELGWLSFGIDCEEQHDGKSRYVTYDGGQMHMPFHVNGNGLVSTYDVGILIFIDGVAQPYQVGLDGEYAYMHTFSQKDGVIDAFGVNTTIADIYFTPITGEEGDMLEFYILCMLNPNYQTSQGVIGFTRTAGALLYATRLQYNDAPPEESYPEKSTRLLDVRTCVVDCTAEDVENWTAEDMITDQRTAFTANGEKPRVYGVTADTQITLRYEVWGSPYVHYALIFFVDNEPVYTADLSDIWVTVEMGQKTVIEATLDMTGFSGESAVYAILVPRNYRTSEIETNATFHEGSTIYLLAKEKDA